MTKITRRKSRESAVIILYQCDLLEKDVEYIIDMEILFGRKPDEFTKILVRGVYLNKDKIDKEIVNVVKNWSFDRIAIIDRNIIRMAVFEMLFLDEIPLKVSVDEAIEISKSLGQKDDTPKFVNGVLGKILTQLEEAV
ncbi:MAG: transcription antitermination factor NusB [Actinobacteria bacterium]|nr:transcription antitermination factor NusB [Actinomycetota bacterium]